jgi:hypothetical protein
MEKFMFSRACSKLELRDLWAVEDSLLQSDSDLAVARRFLVPALNLQNLGLRGGERLIRLSWWRAESSNDFYVWDELANATNKYVPKGLAPFRAAAQVLCFFAFAETEDPAILTHREEAMELIGRLRSLASGPESSELDLEDIEGTDEMRMASLIDLVDICLFGEGPVPKNTFFSIDS